MVQATSRTPAVSVAGLRGGRGAGGWVPGCTGALGCLLAVVATIRGPLRTQRDVADIYHDLRLSYAFISQTLSERMYLIFFFKLKKGTRGGGVV